jgi:choice-of-anchor A domain-containing protein
VGEAYVGGTFTAPQYLLDRRSDVFPTAVGNARFDAAQAYFTTTQNTLAALGVNADYEIKYGNGLFLTCSASSDAYHVKIPASDFNKVDWITLIGCKFSARWIVDVTGNEDVTIKGQPFPAIVERVVYNILGTGRTINGQTGVAGHILSPQNAYNQPQGVTYGKVIVGNVIEARQNNKPNCKKFNTVTLSAVVVKPVQLGDTLIYVADLSNFVAGDQICVQGACRKLWRRSC